MKVLLLAVALMASGCAALAPPRYSVSTDNNQALKSYAGAKARVGTMRMDAHYNPSCRMMGPISAPDGMTMEQFVARAMNDELKMAGIYDPFSEIVLDGRITRFAFSSTASVTRGWWDIAIKMRSSNGKTMAVENGYEFESGFDGMFACMQTSQALGAALQDLIYKMVTDKRFAELIR